MGRHALSGRYKLLEDRTGADGFYKAGSLLAESVKTTVLLVALPALVPNCLCVGILLKEED